MARPVPPASTVVPALARPSSGGAFDALASSWRRHLMAENKAPRTLDTYLDSLRLLGVYLAVQGMPTDPGDVAREHVEAFVADLLERNKPATASIRFRALQQFFKWCA